jgi:hypothetical protein
MQVHTPTRFLLVLLIGIGTALLPSLSGCKRGDGLERIRLSGVVTFKGQPVVDGQLRLVPKPDTVAPVTILPVAGGRYDASTLGGAPVGQYRVEILSFDPKTPSPKGPGDPQRTQFLPSQFNSQSTLDLEVKSGQTEITKDFNLNP